MWKQKPTQRQQAAMAEPVVTLVARGIVSESDKENIREEVQILSERCPGVTRCSELFISWPIVGKLCFASCSDAEQGLGWLWEQRLLGSHRWVPCMLPHDGTFKSSFLDFSRNIPPVRAAFSDYIGLLRSEAIARCLGEIKNVEKELSQVEGRLKRSRRNSQQLRGLKKGLSLQLKLLETKLDEFKAALSCLDMHVNGDDVCFDDKRPVFALGKVWTWEQLQNILQREQNRLEASLPIYSSRQEILNEIHRNQVIVLVGETGSGKSTQLIQFLADSGFSGTGSLICTQPRKVAAMSLSQRVAEEARGCYAEMASVSCKLTYVPQGKNLQTINFMTDHVLLQMCMSDSLLPHVSCIIIDEAHERRLSTDLLLALLKGVLYRRSDLRLIIMSATADTTTLSEYFNCKAVYVQGRHFPVEIQYVGTDETSPSNNIFPKPGYPVISSYVAQALRVAADIHAKEEEGVILVFLTSQAEVEWACEHFKKPSAVTYAFHGKLSVEDQTCVFENVPSGTRKVVFATNIAETSITIPGVKFVVDTGMAKESKYDPKTGTNMLKVGLISRSAAIQRSGRAGRTQPGICYRLYTREDFESMPPQSEPEVLRVHLGIAVLKLLALGFSEVENFDFVQAPNQEAIDQAVKNLIQIGAVEYKERALKLTEFGSKIVKLGVEPRLGKIVLDSFFHGLGKEGVVLAVLIANSGSVFCRVGSEADKSKSDRLKLRFCQADGDLFTLLLVYKKWEHEPYRKRKQWCWENSINSKTMMRCRESIRELENCLKYQLNMIVPSHWKWSPRVSSHCNVILKRIILSSMMENLAMFSGYERLGYDVATTGQQAYLHPSCSLLALGQKPTWVVFGELLCSTRQYLVCVTAVERDLVLQLQSPPYDISQLDRLAMHRRVISGIGSHLLKRFCGKGYGNLHHLIRELQHISTTKRIAIEVEHDKQEIHLFSIAEFMDKMHNFVQDALKNEKKWIFNECMEKALFHSACGQQSQLALLGPGAQIKRLELNERYLSVEVRHPNANRLDDRRLLSIFENRVGNIASFHKFSGTANHESDSGKWGTITFLSAEVAEMAVSQLHNLEVEGFALSVSPLNLSDRFGSKAPAFPAVRATIMWPRRLSKGVAIIKCASEDVDRVALSCSGKQIGTSTVKCRRGKRHGSVFMAGLDAYVTEHQLLQALKLFTDRVILDAFILRNPAAQQPSKSVCEEGLIKELSVFVPRDKFRVVVCNSDTKDLYSRALVTFEGSIHLKAARALTHLQGTVLPEGLPWQKITCQQTFYSTLLIACRIFDVLENELHHLVNSFSQENPGASIFIAKTESASYKVKISSNKMESVAKCRLMLEQLTEGITVADDRLDPEVLQLLFDQQGTQLLRSLEIETGTCIVFEKRSLRIRVFGPAQKTDKAIKGVVEGLTLLSQNQYHDISLRGEGLPYGLMKEIVHRFGVDLAGLQVLIPEGDFVLDTRRHILRARGSREIKTRTRNIVVEIQNCMKGVNHPLAEKTERREHNCPICFCEIDNCYKLEACGHSFCKTCLVEQCNSAMRHRDGFPLTCAYENCTSLILVSDLKSLLTDEQLDQLFAASLESFISSSNGTYRFCTTPDCRSVYEVSTSGRLFVCGSCSAELCTTCHLEYHPYLSCEKYKEFKDDPDASLKEWCKGKEDVKRCPSCGLTIEKFDGCNHVVCRCSKHICWVCLESFDGGESCYSHLHTAHGSIN